jgi:alginate O-acetyltransferase complex protein AlgJ
MTSAHEQPSREAVAKLEIGRTAISRGAARALAGLFLLTIVTVPVVQHVIELRAHEGAPRCYEILGAPSIAADAFAKSDQNFVGRIFDANAATLREINRYEDALADDSWLKNLLVPPTQWAMATLGGVGNEKVYVGRDGWLFYRPAIEYVTGPGFLDPKQIAKREAGGNEYQAAPQPDPVKAILHFNDQLKARGIKLIVFPTPIKSVVYPHRYAGGTRRGPVRNVSYARFADSLHAAGVTVFDPLHLLPKARTSAWLDRAFWLLADTHWSPGGMAACAYWLAEAAKTCGIKQGRTRYKTIDAKVTNTGDLARMLTLPESCDLFPPETVTIQQVFNKSDGVWRADRESDVLLLGDSFTNVFSFDAMGWGFSAGLAEHISLQLGKPIDRIARNDSGAFATRQMLANELARGRDRLKGKKIVIWQFAARELSVGDWKLIDLKLGAPKPSDFLQLGDKEVTTVTGTVASVSSCPRPHSKPYKDYIVTAHLVDIEGRAKSNEAVVYLMGMLDNRWTDAARLRSGQRVTMKLRSWDALLEKTPAMEKVNRGILGEELQLEPICWGEVSKE